MSAEQPAKPAIGFISNDLIRAQPERLDKSIIDRFLALDDLTGTVCDALDKLGLASVVPASVLIPTLRGHRIVGPAVTLRNVPQGTDAYRAMSTKDYRMTELEAVNQAEQGDVLVIQGVRNVSNMGRIVAEICAREKLCGAIVDGGIRDVDKSRAIGFPIWSRDITPTTGKWRAISVEINGTVAIAGATLQAGDLVVADETGTCFVPRDRAEEVLRLCEEVDKKEDVWLRHLKDGDSLSTIVKAIYKG